MKLLEALNNQVDEASLRAESNSLKTPAVAGLGVLNDMLTSAGDARDLSQQQIPFLRKLFEDRDVGLFLFAQHIFGYRDLTASLHLPIARLLGRWGESILTDGSTLTTPPVGDIQVADSYRRLMVIIPRECFKTSLATRANALWTVARDPTHNPTIGIFNEVADNVEKWIAAICEVVESSHLFQVLWREMIPPGISFWDKEAGRTMPRRWKWGGTGVLFTRDSIGVPELSIEPHGIGGSATGKHFTHKILDDIIGEKASQSPAIMADAIAWIDNSRPLERPAEHGCELVCCTPWLYNDVYAHMMRKWSGEYKVYRRSILENDLGEPDAINGESIVPEKISTAKARRLLEVDSYTNWAQYMTIPKAGRSQDFSATWLHYGSIVYAGSEPCFKIDPGDFDPTRCDIDATEPAPQLVPLSWMDKAILLDPAPSKPSELKSDPHCRNGIVVVGIDPWKRRFALDSFALRDTPIAVMHKLMELYVQWHADRIGIEEVNFSAVYAPFMLHIIRREYNLQPTFIPLETKGRQKPSRIANNLRPPFEDGFWYLNRATCGPLVQELLEYPNSMTCDLVDALAYTDEAVFPQATPSGRAADHYRKRHERASLGVTGYGDFV